MSNLALFSEALGAKIDRYGALAHFLNTTVEDCMCAQNYWLETLLSRTRELNDRERAAVISSCSN